MALIKKIKIRFTNKELELLNEIEANVVLKEISKINKYTRSKIKELTVYISSKIEEGWRTTPKTSVELFNLYAKLVKILDKNFGM